MNKLKPAFALIALYLALGLVAGAGSSSAIITVASFAPPSLPAGLAIDRQGNIYLSMALTGEVRKLTRDGTQSTLATLRTGDGFLNGLAGDASGNLYVALASFDSANSDTHGVWRIHPDGTKELFVALSPAGFAHELAFDKRGNLFVSDSFLGTIWRITPARQVSQWVAHPLLQGDPNACPPTELPFGLGANGLAFDQQGNLFVTNTDRGLVVRIPVNSDGSAAIPAVAVGPDCASLEGANGIAFDVNGDLYLTVSHKNKVVRIRAVGLVETLATAADGLDFPDNIAFGTVEGEQKSLLLTNSAALSFFSGGIPHASLMKIQVGVPGKPLP